MDTEIGNLQLNDGNLTKCWLVAFEAHCRSKQIADVRNTLGTSDKTDKFLEKCGSKAILKIISLLPGKNIEHVEFKEIKDAINNYVEPQTRLTIADRTVFFTNKATK